MTDISKLSTLLDDPEIRALIFGLAHVRSASASTESGAPRLRAIVLHLADTTDLEQFNSWLSDDAPNMAMTVDQVAPRRARLRSPPVLAMRSPAQTVHGV